MSGSGTGRKELQLVGCGAEEGRKGHEPSPEVLLGSAIPVCPYARAQQPGNSTNCQWHIKTKILGCVGDEETGVEELSVIVLRWVRQ